MNPTTQQTRTNRVPPQNSEMEMQVLGAIMLDNESIAKALEILSGPHEFYKHSHRLIYSAMIELYEKNAPIDLMTLPEKLRQNKNLDDAGGVDYIADLMDITPTSTNIRAHARIIKEKAISRSLIQIGQNMGAEAFTDTEPVDTQIDVSLSLLLKLSQGKDEKSLTHTSKLLGESIKLVEKACDNKNLISGVTTGFKEIDEKTAGLQPGDLIIIAGRPSMGKTALAINMAQNLTKAEPEKVAAIFSLEMTEQQLVLRMICSEAKVSGHRLRTGYLANTDWPKITQAVANLYERNIYIDDSGNVSALDIRAKVRKLFVETGRVDLVIIDYLQLMKAREKTESRNLELGAITRSLKILAKELDVPIVALSQLSRKVEERADKRPMLSDLRESGAIEQDADVVMFVYREEFYAPEKPEAVGKAEIIIGKQRNGPLGIVEVAFLKDYTLFTDLEKGEYHG